MDNEDVWEVLKESEWEQIPPLFPPSPNTAQWDDDDDDDGDTVVIGGTSSHSSVFPPFNHEGLPVIPQEPPRLPSPPLSSAEDDGKEQRGVKGEVGRRLRERLGVLSSGIVRLAHRVRNYSFRGAGLWLIAIATGGAVAVIFAMASLRIKVKGWRRRRPSLSQQENVDKLKLLLREKDQRINQLLLQIAEMNENLSRSRRIPVHRVG